MCQNCEVPVIDSRDIMLKAARHCSDRMLWAILVAAGIVIDD